MGTGLPDGLIAGGAQRDPRLHPVHINQVQYLIGFEALEEHHIHPPQ